MYNRSKCTTWQNLNDFTIVSFAQPQSKCLLLLKYFYIIHPEADAITSAPCAWFVLENLSAKTMVLGKNLGPLGWMITPSFTPRGEHTLLCRRTQGPADPRDGGQLHPWGSNKHLPNIYLSGIFLIRKKKKLPGFESRLGVRFFNAFIHCNAVVIT
jgi:hypothetical protein